MSNLLLDIVEKPPITLFNHHAQYLSILFTDKNFVHSFYNDYINMVSTKDPKDLWCNIIYEKKYTQKDHYLNFSIIESTEGLSNIPFIHNKNLFIKIIMDMMDKENYLIGNFDEYYIPHRNAYMTFHFAHDYLLIGYDDIERKFIVAAYDDKGIYHSHAVSYDEFYDAILNLENILDFDFSTKNYMLFLKRNKMYKHILDTCKIKNNLLDYIYSKSTCGSCEVYENEWCIFGIEVLKKAANFFKNIYDSDIHAFTFMKGILEHKQCMYNRIEYLNENGYINDESILLSARICKENINIAHNLLLKNSLAVNAKTINKIAYYLEEIISLEEKYIPLLIAQL